MMKYTAEDVIRLQREAWEAACKELRSILPKKIVAKAGEGAFWWRVSDVVSEIDRLLSRGPKGGDE